MDEGGDHKESVKAEVVRHSAHCARFPADEPHMTKVLEGKKKYLYSLMRHCNG